MVEIISKKFVKVGNGHFIHIPKALIDCKVLNKEKVYKVTVEEVDNAPLVSRFVLNHQNCYGVVA